MSDSRFKRLFTETEDLPLHNVKDVDLEKNKYNPSSTFPKFNKFLQNTINSIKEDKGLELSNYDNPEKNKTEDTPELIKTLFPNQVNRYQALKNFEEYPDKRIDRSDIDNAIVRAVLEKTHPTLTNNLKYNKIEDPFYEDTVKDAASKFTNRDKDSLSDFNADTKTVGYGSYDPQTGEIALHKGLKEYNDVVEGVSTYLHELNHKEHPVKRSGYENTPDFSSSNYPASLAAKNNRVDNFYKYLHNKTIAPKTTQEIDTLNKDDDIKKQFKERLESMGMQYNLFEDALKHNIKLKK